MQNSTFRYHGSLANFKRSLVSYKPTHFRSLRKAKSSYVLCKYSDYSLVAYSLLNC